MYNKEAWLKQIDDVIDGGPYTDDWASLEEHRTPKWFRDAKFGIFIHWGVYSVPAFGNEWYPRNMYIQGSPEYEHHLAVYGPQKDFGYRDFIPMFRAEHFDPAAWAGLFKRAGARYVVPVAEHHDGFQMYRSELSHWNAYEMGPHRDVLGELTEEIQKQGLVNCASSHRIEHWFFMGHGREFESDVTDDLLPGDLYWPAMPEPKDHFDLFSKPAPTKEFLDDWMIRTCEIIDRYHVKQIYFDWWIQHECAKPYLKKIAAYYYNRAVQRGEEVMITYKQDAFQYGSATVDIERGQFAACQPDPWQTCTSISKKSWGYITDNEFKSAREIICDLADVVSKNGCMLLNVGPRPDGTITEEETKVLLEIGDWLSVNGEAIYGSRVWRICEEGPAKMQDGGFTDGEAKEFTPADFRFTVKGDSIYAICLSCPDDGHFTIKSLATCKDPGHITTFHGIIDEVSILGFDERPEWKRTDRGLEIFTKSVKSDKPVTVKVKLR